MFSLFLAEVSKRCKINIDEKYNRFDSRNYSLPALSGVMRVIVTTLFSRLFSQPCNTSEHRGARPLSSRRREELRRDFTRAFRMFIIPLVPPIIPSCIPLCFPSSLRYRRSRRRLVRNKNIYNFQINDVLFFFCNHKMRRSRQHTFCRDRLRNPCP